MKDEAGGAPVKRGIFNTSFVLFLIASVIIIAVCYYLYSSEKKQIRQNYENSLTIIARVKQQQIRDWRQERLANIAAISEGPIIQGNYERWLKKGRKDEQIKGSLLNLLQNWKNNYNYDAVLLDKRGNIELSLDSRNITYKFPEFFKERINKVTETGKIVFGDFYFCELHGRTMIDVAAPLRGKNGNKLLGILLLRVDPLEKLLPIVQSWPAASETSEALLVRREGNAILYLHELRHKKKDPLSLKLPLETGNLPAAFAATGHEGILHGFDYRGVSVFAAVKRIPDSPWYLVVKTDSAEVFSPAHANLIRYAVIGFSLIALAFALIWIFSARQKKNYYKKLYIAEKERQQAEDALQESEFKYRSFFELSHESMTIFRDKEIINANEAAKAMFQMPVDEIIGKHFWDFLPEYQPDGTSSREAGKDAVRRLLKNDIHGSSFFFRRADGTEFEGDATINSIVLNGERYYQSIIRDITERREAEKALRQSEEKYRSLLNNASDPILLADLEGNVVEANKKAEELFGYSLPELIDLNITQLHPPESLPGNMETFNKIVEQGSGAISDSFILKKNGAIVPVDVTGGTIEYGKLKIVQVIFRDISERKKTEEEYARLEERLQRSEKMEALGMLAGGVAHDLNNVLGVIVGYAELLMQGLPEQTPNRKRIENIMNSAERATAIVQDLLTLARRGVQNKKVVNLNSMISDYLKSPEFRKLASYHLRVQIKTSLEANLLNTSLSPIHLTKTLMNLISNAAEAMPEGGTITISTENRYIDRPIEGYDEVKTGDYVVLTISDNGEGISPEDRKRIFEPFYTKKIMGRSGTGLGLSVVWGTVKDSQGYIDVHSEYGQGTSFILYFPVSREEISPQKSAVDKSDYTGRKETILVVDDIQEQRELATQMLTELNYRVESAASGEMALSYLRNHHADIIVLDMIMEPGMDGLTTFEEIRKIRPQQKAIIVSGFSETDRVQKAQAAGAGAYVKKPYIQSQLGLAIRRELDKK